MFGNQQISKKSINCGAGADLVSKFGISALASKAVKMLTSIIGTVGAVFYMIFSFILNQSKEQFNFDTLSNQIENFENYNSDSYVCRLEESAAFIIQNSDPNERVDTKNRDKNQIKFVNDELFFSTLLSEKQKITKQKSKNLKNVEQVKQEKHKNEKNSSTDKIRNCFLEMFLFSIE